MAILSKNPEMDSELQAAFRAGGGLVDPKPFTAATGAQALIVPEGYTVAHFPPTDPQLTHIKARPRLDDETSFIAYVNRFKMDQTVIFADIKANLLTAIIDYHQESWAKAQAAGDSAGKDTSGSPDYCDHMARHPCPWSIEWERWRSIDGKPMTQKLLGLFLEEMLYTIAAPAGADLLEIASELKVDREVRFKSGTRLQDGTVALAYEETDQTSNRAGKITVPDLITIVAPVFMGGDPMQFSARLRYQIERGDLSFKIDIMNRLEGEQEAFQIVASNVEIETGRPVFYGAA